MTLISAVLSTVASKYSGSWTKTRSTKILSAQFSILKSMKVKISFDENLINSKNVPSYVLSASHMKTVDPGNSTT